MEYRRFGRTDLQVSVIGLGTGGSSVLGQGSNVPEPEAHRVVHRALDLGINLIDTAADYRESEAILGRALRDVPRDRYILCTKFKAEISHRGQTPAMTLKSEEAIIASLEHGLQMLGTDYIDLFQFHGIPPELYPEIRDRFVPIVRRFQEQGKVRFLGVTESFADDHRRDTLRMALQDDLYDAMMVGYNLMTPSPEQDVLPEAQRKDVGVLVMCAVRRKIANQAALEALVKELKANGEIPADSLPDVGPLDWLVHDETKSITAAAYKFAKGHPAVSCVLTGTANMGHLEDNVRDILGAPLPDADRARVIRIFGPVTRKLGN